MKKVFYIFVFVVFLVAISLIYLPPYLSVTSNQYAIEINIPWGASFNYVSEILYNEGVIKSQLWFKYIAKSSEVDKKIRPGTYILSPNMSIEEIFDLLQTGSPDEQVIVTIPEGLTIYQMAKKFESAGFGTSVEFIEATNDYFSSQDFDFPTDGLFFPLEGYLYPDTYYFRPDQTMHEIVERLAKKMNDVLTEEYRNQAEEMNLTIHEVLTIAALIEKEAFNDEERPVISGVIQNRLNKNMLLQFCSSVIYGLNDGTTLANRLLYKDLEVAHPFNTYMYLNLPPGPIAAPGKSSIHAALYPAEHDYLYFVVSENGHAFSTTYQYHMKNVYNYRNRTN